MGKNTPAQIAKELDCYDEAVSRDLREMMTIKPWLRKKKDGKNAVYYFDEKKLKQSLDEIASNAGINLDELNKSWESEEDD